MLKLKVCIGRACHIKGSYNVINTFQKVIEEKNLSEKVEICAVFCLGHCTQAVSVQLGDGEEIYSVSGPTAREFFEREVEPRLAD